MIVLTVSAIRVITLNALLKQKCVNLDLFSRHRTACIAICITLESALFDAMSMDVNTCTGLNGVADDWTRRRYIRSYRCTYLSVFMNSEYCLGAKPSDVRREGDLL